ncbi:MAG: PilZ domain-containing protein [Acidobacteriota bacterium]
MRLRFRDKRRFPRIPSAYPVMLENAGKEEGGFTRTNEMGLGGCSFSYHQELKKNVQLRLYIKLKDRVIQAEGTVVYANPDDEEGYEIGVEFLGISEEDSVILDDLLQAPEKKK